MTYLDKDQVLAALKDVQRVNWRRNIHSLVVAIQEANDIIAALPAIPLNASVKTYVAVRLATLEAYECCQEYLERTGEIHDHSAEIVELRIVLEKLRGALPALPDLQQKYDALRSWADGAEIDLAEMERAAELYRDLTDLVVAANRMLDNWAEGDQSVKNDLWRSLHTLAAEIADRQGLFPLGSPEGARLGVCGAAYQTDVGEGVETYFCQLPPHKGKHEWGVTKPKETSRALPVLETKKETT